ncbi:MAG TPA: GTP pyrophosphokinase family protein [Defluviitaleaceae bacterium]|nr:GTP pyrophosphokinase family protein [Defluviitaleaceae bacterium]HPT77077.1 GTP pyrophosphokinase family protein [Defluviitaleaceae bacterium]
MDLNEWKRFLIPYEQAVEELKVKFMGIREEYIRLEEYSPIEYVTGRVKKISSILEKAQRKGIPLEEIEKKIEDIAGVRIICQFVKDIDKVVKLIRERDGKDLRIVEERDYIKNIKPSGYRSYHIIIKYPLQTIRGEKEILTEIQIRTLAMNFWATIEHSLRYKYKKDMPDYIHKRLLSAAEAAFTLDKEMSEIREEVLKAQEQFEARSNMIAEIFTNIQNLSKINEIKEAGKLYQKFWEIWEEGDIEKLEDFNRKLDILAEIYGAQRLH